MNRTFFDMDGVCARFHDSILDSDGSVQIELMYEKDFFRNLEPFQNMIDAIKLFIAHHPEVEVYILSAAQQGDPPGFVRQKNEWLDEFLPEIDIDHRIYPECGVAKSSYIPCGISFSDYLFDDFNKNLNEWIRDGGRAIKCKNNINHRGTGKYGGDVGNLWIGDMVSNLDPPEEILKHLEDFMGLEHKKETSLNRTDVEKEILTIAAYPIKDNYPAVEIDISRRDLEKVLNEIYKDEDDWPIQKFLYEYTWDEGEQVKDFLEAHPDFCQDIVKINDFSNAKYTVVITDWDKTDDCNNIYKHSIDGFYPYVIDEAFVEKLFKKGYEGYRVIVTDFQCPTWENVLYDAVLDDSIIECFADYEKEQKKANEQSLDYKIQHASKENEPNCKGKNPDRIL